jgi:ubiquitin C-terminal hydrolase
MTVLFMATLTVYVDVRQESLVLNSFKNEGSTFPHRFNLIGCICVVGAISYIKSEKVKYVRVVV